MESSSVVVVQQESLKAHNLHIYYTQYPNPLDMGAGSVPHQDVVCRIFHLETQVG